MPKSINLKFIINKEAEIENSVGFINDEIQNEEFIKERVTSLYPELSVIFKQRKSDRTKTLSNFIINYYQENSEDLNMSKALIEKRWNKIQLIFEKRLSEYIKLKQENFTCYLSIFATNPILGDFRSFQLYFRTRKEITRIIAHETTHLIYYQDKSLIPNDDVSWKIAELYAYFLLNEPGFEEIIGKEPGYKEHMLDAEKLKDIWQKTKFDPIAFFVSAKDILTNNN